MKKKIKKKTTTNQLVTVESCDFREHRVVAKKNHCITHTTNTTAASTLFTFEILFAVKPEIYIKYTYTIMYITFNLFDSFAEF